LLGLVLFFLITLHELKKQILILSFFILYMILAFSYVTTLYIVNIIVLYTIIYNLY